MHAADKSEQTTVVDFFSAVAGRVRKASGKKQRPSHFIELEEGVMFP